MQTLKFSPRTLQILKNFSAIEPSLQFKEGNTIRTMSSSKGVVADAVLDVSFERTFCLADISSFLSLYSTFKDPVLEIGEYTVVVSQGQRKLTLGIDRPECIKLPPEGSVNFADKIIEFDFTQEFMLDLVRSVKTIRHDFVSLNGNGTEISFSTFSENDPNSLTKYEITSLGKTDRIFKFIFRVDNLMQVLPDNYHVEIILKKGGKGLSKFYSQDLAYYVAVEANSKLEQ
jgi:hypothetical protein